MGGTILEREDELAALGGAARDATDGAGTARQVFPVTLTLPIISVQIAGPGVLVASVC